MAEYSQNFMPEKATLFNRRRVKKFTQRLEEENIIEDNIYSMIDILFTWTIDKKKEQIKKIETNIEILKDDSLTFMFCTNATGSHKLLPFCTYKYKHEEVRKYLKNIESPFLSKLQSRKLKTEDNFVYWYNNYFIKSVRKHQENTNIRGKVLLLLTETEKSLNLKEIIKDNNFEILFIPITIFQPLDQKIRNEIQLQFFNQFPHFCTSRDIGNLIEGTCKPWTNITSAHIETLWRKLFESDFHIKVANITEENTAEEISKPQSSRETERDKQEHQENTVSAANSGLIESTESTEEKEKEDYLKHWRELNEKLSNYIDLNKVPDLNDILEQSISQDNLTEYPSSYGKAEGYQKEQEDIKNTQTEYIPPILEMHDIIEQYVSSINLTEDLNIYGKAEGEGMSGTIGKN